MPLMVSASDPVFVNDTVCAALVEPTTSLPNVSDPGLTSTELVPPTPLKLIVCGVLNALSAI
jgi:hypothetical protein